MSMSSDLLSKLGFGKKSESSRLWIAFTLTLLPLLVLAYFQQWLLLSALATLLVIVQLLRNSRLHRSNSALKQASSRLHEERARYQTFFDNAPEAYIVLSAKNGEIIDCNEGAVRMLASDKAELLGKLPFELSPEKQPNGESSKSAAKQIANEIVKYGQLTFEWVHKSITDEQFWVEVEVRKGIFEGESVYFSTWRNIEKRKALEAELLRLVNQDQLTGLLNRYSLKQAFDRLLAQSQRRGSKLALFFIDLDKFKYVNDSFGHKMGDQLLIEVAHRLRDSVRRNDLVARLGGDEFVLAFSDIENIFAVDELATKLAQLFEKPVEINGHQLQVGLSIGIANYPLDGDNFDSLLQSADNALYEAKGRGRGQHQFFSPEMADMAAEHLRLEQGIRQALYANDFQLVYQQQISLQDRSVFGVEALLRWNDPERGLIYPDQFLSVAADSHLIEQLERWVVVEAFTQARTWHESGIKFGRMAVNLSARSLQRGYAPQMIREALEQTGCPAELLEAEISENFALHGIDSGIKQLNEIRALGLELSLDDFGIGFSSLSYLKLMPLDKIKIDKSFINDITEGKDNLEIVTAIIAMVHKLNLRVIAEGVETEAQLALLLKDRCDVAQGYLFARPLPAEEIFQLSSR